MARRPRGVLRHSRADALLVALALLHGVALLAMPVAPLVALGVWWGSNTIAHNFIHRPFFRDPSLNRLFGCYLSVLLSIPQSAWHDRHLAHHAQVTWRLRVTRQLLLEVGLIAGSWAALLVQAPEFLLATYLPGYAIGLVLCFVHGHYEHARGATSHYGGLYNRLFFNDGYHAEHHADPGLHWTRLPARLDPAAPTSRWPAVLRWLDLFSLESMEHAVLRSAILQRFMLTTHERAFRSLLALLDDPREIAIVGGALFPRTALILRRVLPRARLVIIDANPTHLQIARSFLPADVECVQGWHDPLRDADFPLVVIPLAYVGDRAALYRHPARSAVLVHDWLWRRWTPSAIISLLLLKRLNLVQPPASDQPLVPAALQRSSLGGPPGLGIA